ncbi:putative glycosyl transferase family protein [Clostridium botulinum]|uniref:CDP-glycerol glycerophosphotransferase family protein n=1 Tax=Clostridium botulinum TaxID=1491 RepID=UPI0005821C95|nr:CDP-glycerol glycerophosphotransferase family protein [Clostridium botulinum]BAQ14354.1 putative glycosyl transferase family protein [Clostridium botulinum]
MQDMEQYKKKVKENIEELINSNALEEAKKIIKEYKKLVTNDVDIYSFEAVIAMLEGSMDEAEVILKKGNTIYQYSFDILYNLGYLYESVSNNELAIEYYKKALINCNNENEEYVAYNSLTNLGIKDTKGNIISNIIAQKHYEDAIKLDKIGNKSDAALYYGLAYKHSENKELKSRIEDLYNNNESLKDIFNVAAKSKKKRFIILSSCGWSNIYQRMHHISRSLVKLENEVIYIEPNIQANINNEKVSLDALVKHSINNSKIVDGVKIYSPILAIHNEKVISNNYTYLVQNLLDAPTNANKTIIVTYMPYQVDVISSLKGNFMHIYDCVDDHSDLDYAFWGNKKDVVLEQELMDKADAITTTATSLYLERVAIEERENVYLSRNAVNEGDFIFEEDYMPEDLKNIPEPRIVYTGVVYERYDEKLFYDVVDSNPDKSFVVIGPIQDGMLKQKRNNLHLLGPKKHSDLKVYLKYMQIGIVPYIDTADMDIACDSIKQYEYIACGLPVITTYMPESAMDKIYTFLANTKDNFNQAIEECLNLEINKNTLSCFLAENSWNARATLLCNIADHKISNDETNNLIKSIESTLTSICTRYNWPIFETLRAICLNLKDGKTFEACMEKVHNNAECKYIERQYLTALLQNKNISTFINVVQNSKYISKELKEELLNAKNNIKRINVVGFLCIGNIIKALEVLKEIKNNDFKIIYELYIRYLLGEYDFYKKLNLISIKNQQNVLVKFLTKDINPSKCDNERDGYIYVADMFNNISQDIINKISINNMKISGLCGVEEGVKYNVRIFSIQLIAQLQNYKNIKIIVPYDNYYINQVRILAENGINQCYVGVISGEKLKLIDIDNGMMRYIKNKKYNRTITFNKFNAADSNVHALIKYIPEEYSKKYNLNIIYGRDVWSIDNIVKVPLISNVTVSGFATFLYNYPKFTYNIEVGHDGVTLKSCGLMDKKNKNSGANSELYEKADCVCVASNLDMIVKSSFYGIPENKYEITGLPRNDVLSKKRARGNLEKLLNINLDDKKVIFNMPTFHVFDQIGRIEGSSELTDSFKIKNFNYDEFNNFIRDNNLICVSKVHHGEESSVTEKTKNRRYSNLFFINNNDLDKNNLDLYEILGVGDILITDYSTVYNDFLFMDKPTIFLISDIEEYREKRGLALEPYDFWTAGPKVMNQARLQEEIIKFLNNKDEYKIKRNELMPVFFKYKDSKAIQRVWKVIDDAIRKKHI